MNCQGVAVQGKGSSPLMDRSMSSCCPLGWRHCDGKDSHDSLMVKSRHQVCRGPHRGCRDPSAALGAPQCLPSPQPHHSPAPSPAHIRCFHRISCLPDLSEPPHPQSLPTSSSGFCPELQRAQPPLEPKRAPSPPARAPGPGTWKCVLTPRSEPQVWPHTPHIRTLGQPVGF